jgi:hypothetical protein
LYAPDATFVNPKDSPDGCYQERNQYPPQ